MVGSMSTSDGAHRIQSVPAGGSSSAFSKIFDAVEVIRSASSMIMMRKRPTEEPIIEVATSSRISAMVICTFSVDNTWMSGCVPALARTHDWQRPHPCSLHWSAAAKANARLERPDPGGPVISQEWNTPSSRFRTAVSTISTASVCARSSCQIGLCSPANLGSSCEKCIDSNSNRRLDGVG